MSPAERKLVIHARDVDRFQLCIQLPVEKFWQHVPDACLHGWRSPKDESSRMDSHLDSRQYQRSTAIRHEIVVDRACLSRNRQTRSRIHQGNSRRDRRRYGFQNRFAQPAVCSVLETALPAWTNPADPGNTVRTTFSGQPGSGPDCPLLPQTDCNVERRLIAA